MTVTLRTDAGGDRDLRSLLFAQHVQLAQHLARRFAGRGEPLEDLTQVAMIGLLKAADRFDESRGVAFTSYATPTILGELKRHFRDTTWAVRVSRALKELAIRVPRATEDLTHALRRTPTRAEIAGYMGVSTGEVYAAQRCGSAYRLQSLDQPISQAGESPFGVLLGASDRGYAAVEARETLRDVVTALPERDRRLLHLRYVEGRTQTEMAAELGVSQMQISRLLAQIMNRMRSAIEPGDEPRR
ncbi:SigB/SigF/SigG family RNA polymerase sigma factor [Mangrovihabitans endophyticus]|uniref:RNA polymerase sigma-B factor n=1 Tax=Mangrovihabitans endophyticus TaxID=1751298 RepID=A0A8J3BVY8_9ACTN|nr:SigB/SigF/SigG family RNA polymerase sigma factor [Mangrovihabitans endophyticus]GGK73498.1 hypothetical protein GCM10012284_04230 [Mangrovihabitans endophyticus]